MYKYDGKQTYEVKAIIQTSKFPEIEAMRQYRATSNKDAWEQLERECEIIKYLSIENLDSKVNDCLYNKAVQSNYMIHQHRPISNNVEDTYKRYCILISKFDKNKIVVGKYHADMDEFETISFHDKLSEAIKFYHIELGGE